MDSPHDPAGETTPHRAMPSTHWSLVRRAGMGDAEARRHALSELLHRYLPALRTFLLSARRVPADRVDDLLQGFVTDKMIEQEILRHAESGRGRFRTFLLTSLSHYAISQWRKEAVRHRVDGTGLDDVAAPASPLPTPDAAFDAAWARALLDEVLRRMEAACQSRPDLWAVFSARVLPEMRGETAAPYTDLVRQLNLQSPMQAANLLVSAKRLYTRLVREVISEYEPAGDIDQEIRDLRSALRTR